MDKYGSNIEASLDAKGKLTIVVDTTKKLRKSKSGENTIIASSDGTFTIGEGLKVNVNVYVKD